MQWSHTSIARSQSPARNPHPKSSNPEEFHLSALAIGIDDEFTRDLAMDITSLSFIRENARCRVYRAKSADSLLIIKKYQNMDSSLVEAEASALDLYHSVAESDNNLIDSRTVFFNREKNIIGIGFVDGSSLTRLVGRGNLDDETRDRSLRIMGTPGRLLRRFYDLTRQPEAQTSPALFEYFAHCSKRLEEMSGVGPVLFRGYEESAERLIESFRRARVSPSFAHGDFVTCNIHVAGERAGLIDFAQTDFRSHLLNDLYNLSFALKNMYISSTYRDALRSALTYGLGELSFPVEAHRFYYEYQRRRWLMLKIRSSSLAGWAQAARGLLSFARPFKSKGLKK